MDNASPISSDHPPLADVPDARSATPALTKLTFGQRVACGLLASACAAPLVAAALVVPDSRGHGTHTQFGWPECGVAVATGYPCPTCGMTTAFAHAAQGDLVAGFVSQPLGLLLALGSAAMMWVALHSALTGSRAVPLAARLLQPGPMWALAGLAVAAWGYKVLTWPGLYQ